MPHIHEHIDFTVSVYIVNGDVTLLRMHEKYNAWLPVGGHVELDEDPNQAALREAKEESGLDVVLLGQTSEEVEEPGYQSLVPPDFMDRWLIAGGPHVHVDLVYFARSIHRDLRPREAEVSTDMKWFTREELEDSSFELWDTVRAYALAALAAVQ